jgi:hypothetical protein
MLLFFNLIEISFIPVPADSGDPDERFACWRSQRPLSTKPPNLRHVEQWLIRVESYLAPETTANIRQINIFFYCEK